MNRNFQFWLIYSLAWIPYALGYGVVFITHIKLNVANAALDSIFNILPAALLGVGVVWICRKFTPSSTHPIVFGLTQLVLALSYAALWSVTVPLMFSLLWLLHGRGWQYKLFGGYALQWQFFAGLMIYATIASIVYMLQFSRRAREEQARALHAEHLRTEAELTALRAQLNPHFLFNTLHSLMVLVRTDTAAAEKAIESLAALLRYSLKSKRNQRNDDVPLSAEWAFVQNYLALEQLRLGDRLKVEADLPSDTFDYLLPAFTLQPLVENSIKHAVAPHPQGAKVSIVARIENDCLRLEVKDNGSGVLPENMFANGGTGLRVMRQRLETRYRGASDFRVETTPGAGFRVVLLIPQEETFEGDE
jgi:signal transduction histidine kinase